MQLYKIWAAEMHNKKKLYTKSSYNPKELLRFAFTIGKDWRSLFCGAKAYKTDKQHFTLIQYHYGNHSQGVSHIPVATSCVSEASNHGQNTADAKAHHAWAH